MVATVVREANIGGTKRSVVLGPREKGALNWLCIQ